MNPKVQGKFYEHIIGLEMSEAEKDGGVTVGPGSPAGFLRV